MLEVIEATTTGMPVLDIMVPTHNRLDLTMRCLQAIYFCTKSPFHLIIVDDSDDNLTPLYFKELIGKGVTPLGASKNITFIHSDVPYKEGNQFFNIALRYCKSEYLATVMNSVRVEPDWETFAIQNLLAQNPDVGLIGLKNLFGGDTNDVGHIESAGIKMSKYLPTDVGRGAPGHRLTGIAEMDAVQWAFAIVRKKAAIGNLEEGVFHGFKGWDDIDNCFCLKNKGWRILYCGFGAGYHEPRATRGDNSPLAEKQNLENGERFYKRWGLWEQFQKDHPPGTDLHTMPKEIKAMQDMQERTAFQQNREEVPT